MASDDEYAVWQFRAGGVGVNGSHRSATPEQAPTRVVERSGQQQREGATTNPCDDDTSGQASAAHGSVDRERAFEPGRFARAVVRPIKRIGPGQYAVKGNVEEVYYVDLSQDPPCHCIDSRIRGLRCLHTIAALLQERDAAAMAELVDRFIRQQQRLRDAGLED